MADSFDTDYMPGNTLEVFQQLKSQAFISRFTLVGGTALAMQIRHRLSEDLDFISDEEEINTNLIKRHIGKIFPDYRIIRQDHNLQLDILINLTKELVPNLSPVTYSETLVYTKDIEEKDISAHLSPSHNVTKEQIASFFSQELVKIKEQI